MVKRLIGVGLILVVFMTMAIGLASGASGIKIGMVTNSGTIDDKSFNQGTWEGIRRAGNEFGLGVRYLKPEGTTEADYMKEIGNLYDAGFRLIICPGFPFETAVFHAQNKYSDAYFVLIDGTPHAGDFKSTVRKNTVSILFSEHESGFLAGVATALELNEGAVGFIGGMAVPSVQRFNWGFQQGIKYANEKFGAQITIKPEHVIYQGSFDNVAAGQQLAAQMYDQGVKVIFCAAGAVGIGVINEAKARARAGLEVWVVGVDRDQYWDGIYENNKSVVLTSAVKKVDQAAFAMVKALSEGKFPGGKTLIFDAVTDGVGIPKNNPNLATEIQDRVDEVLLDLKSGRIVVSGEQGGLIK